MCHDHIPTCHGGKGMILEEETYEKFGYYPSDLKPKSGKRILAACDECGKIRELRKDHYSDFCRSCVQKGEKNHFYGKHPSKEAKQKLSDARKGEKNPRFGKHHSEETKQKISEANKGEKHPRFGKHHSKETKQKQSKAKRGKKASQTTKAKLREARKHRKIPTHHTKPELIFEEICKKHNLPFKYTGDGSFWIGKNPSVNPDFVECNGKKTAVEIFGDYWHSPLLNYGLKENRTLSYRKKILKKYGWKLIVFWESDLKREDAEQFILNEMQKR